MRVKEINNIEELREWCKTIPVDPDVEKIVLDRDDPYKEKELVVSEVTGDVEYSEKYKCWCAVAPKYSAIMKTYSVKNRIKLNFDVNFSECIFEVER